MKKLVKPIKVQECTVLAYNSENTNCSGANCSGSNGSNGAAVVAACIGACGAIIAACISSCT